MPCYSKLESFRYEVDFVTNVPMLKLLGLAGFSGTKYTPTACQDQLLLLFVIVSNIAISSGLSRLCSLLNLELLMGHFSNSRFGREQVNCA